MYELELRIQKLESESEIRKLKARYLNACDTKNVEAIRDCFTSDAEIQFPPLGNFDLDGLIKIFQEVAATTPIYDVHHGHNGEIEIEVLLQVVNGILALPPMIHEIKISV